MNFYIIEYQIGQGSFGKIFKARSIIDSQPVAIKIQNEQNNDNSLKHEMEIYKQLQGQEGIPKVYLYSKNNDYLIMELMGPSLQDLFQFCSHQFTLQTVLKIGYQLIKRIELLHQNGFIHQDIKPENILISLDDPNLIYLMDLGQCENYIEKYRNSQNNPYYETEFKGSYAFCSINCHYQMSLSLRDDLISVGYILLYFYFGYLPWLNQSTVDNLRVMKQLDYLSKEYQCIPQQIQVYLEYVYELQFNSKPEYDQLKQLLDDQEDDSEVDWIQKKKKYQSNNEVTYK